MIGPERCGQPPWHGPDPAPELTRAAALPSGAN